MGNNRIMNEESMQVEIDWPSSLKSLFHLLIWYKTHLLSLGDTHCSGDTIRICIDPYMMLTFWVSKFCRLNWAQNCVSGPSCSVGCSRLSYGSFSEKSKRGNTWKNRTMGNAEENKSNKSKAGKMRRRRRRRKKNREERSRKEGYSWKEEPEGNSYMLIPSTYASVGVLNTTI